MTEPRILIIGYYGFRNAGDELMLAALLRAIRELRPAARITVVSGDEADTRARHGVDTVPYIPSGRVQRWRVMLKSVASADVVLFGGGTFLQDYGFRGWRPISYYLKLVLAARLLGKEVGILGAGAGPLVTGMGRFIARLIVDLSHVTVMRDEASVQVLQQLGFPPGALRLGADLVTAGAVVPPRSEGRARSKVGVSFFPFFAYVHNDSERQQRMTAEVAKLLSVLSSDYELTFFCFQEEVDGADNLFADELTGRYGIRCRKILFSDGAEAFVSTVAEMDCVIGMRYHFVLLALLAGVPEICAVSYHPKVAALMNEMDLAENVIDLELFTSDVVLTKLSKLKRHYGNSASVRDYLERGEVNNAALSQLLGGRTAPGA
jgi:polysaccharide pyruvyl transferase CsaB